jgi:hypothetical protein
MQLKGRLGRKWSRGWYITEKHVYSAKYPLAWNVVIVTSQKFKHMNKMCITAGLFITTLAMQNNIQAQGNSLPSVNSIAATTVTPHSYKIDSRAVRDFNKNYKGVSGAQWYTTKEGGLICRFIGNNGLCRAFYNKRGSWLYTIATYDGSKMAPELRANVAREYVDHAISCVNEITMPGKKTIYLVQAENNKAIKLVRVSAEGMETIGEIEKL